jgi:hypothetical protein
MQDLREIILLLQAHDSYPLRGLETFRGSKSKLHIFYEGIAKGLFNSDQEAAQHLYGEGAEGSKYRKLKSDLRDKLQKAVFYLNLDAYNLSDFQRAYYDCNRQWVALRTLSGQGANTAALSVATRLLKQTEKFDLTLLSMDIASFLRIQYGLRESNDRKFREANKLFEHHRNVYAAESSAEELYTTLMVRYVNNRSAHRDVHPLAVKYYEELEPSLDHYNSYRLHMYARMIGLMRFTAVSDYQGAYEYTNECIQFFENLPYEARTPLQVFYYQRLVCNVHLRQFAEGEESIAYCLKQTGEGTFNWFKIHELYLHLSIHTKQYDRAAEILLQILQHPKFDFLPENAKEIWRVFEAYVYYLAQRGRIKNTPLGKFKLAKFINETPIFARDKSGVNVAILTVKLLLQLQEGKYNQLVDLAESVEQYCYRHLRGAQTQRSYHFLRALILLPQSAFNRNTVLTKAGPHLEALAAMPFQLANQTLDIEIIPYEDLWEMALESLA